MSEAPSIPGSSPTLAWRLLAYLSWWLLLAAIVAPLATIDNRPWGGNPLYRAGVVAWSTHVLILVAVLVLSAKSLVVAFQLGLLAAVLQGYFQTVSVAFWTGQWGGDAWDEQIQLALMLGLSAALYGVMWLLVRVVWKTVLSPEALERSGRSGQLGLREMLYIMASLSAFLAFVSLFSLPGLIPVEEVLATTFQFAAQVGPMALVLFWLAVHPGTRSWHWKWAVPLMLLYAACLVWFPSSNFGRLSLGYAGTAFTSIVLATVAAVAINAALLHLLGLTLRQGGAAPQRAASSAEL